MDATTFAIVISTLIPRVIVFAIALFAIYWVIRKAIRDELKSLERGDTKSPLQSNAD